MHKQYNAPGIYPANQLFIRCITSIIILVTSFFVCAQTDLQPPEQENIIESVQPEDDGSGVITYSAAYFERFRPNTALDMVRQVPGFQLSDNSNDTTRGFGGALGNLFINNRRPTAKQDSLPSILARIPAITVDRVELIRSQVRNIDLRGQAIVVNIVLREDIPAAIRWETTFRKTFGHGPLKPEANVSISDVWQGIEYNAGIDARPSSIGREGIDEIFDNERVLTEKRLENRENRNVVIKPSFTASSWFGDTLLQFNTNHTYDSRNIYFHSQRFPQATGANQNEIYIDEARQASVTEAGIDVERKLISDLTGKGIFLYLHRTDDNNSRQSNLDFTGFETLSRLAENHIKTTELITRFEFDWSGLQNHQIQANIERAYNVLDGSLIQTDDTGNGAVNINIPGANSRVEETRLDFLLKDTWIFKNIEFEYGLGAEASTIAQTGDAVKERSFFFVKPESALSYTSEQGNKTRIRLAREVSQLNLAGFVSTTVFEDDDLALGNPDLQPDSTWKMEISHDRRFSNNSVVRLSLFHHWISDVLDLLPLSANFEAPGNIGDGRRWGVKIESTIPLDWLKLEAAKLNIKVRWQDSRVTDPVTNDYRSLSIGTISGGPIIFNIDNRYGYEIDYRQDFQQHHLAWGWMLKARAEQYQYKVDELEIYDEGMDIQAFIETTRWFGVKMQLIAENIANFKNYRDRIIYSGERELSPLQSIETRQQTRGVRLQLLINGSY